MFWTLTSRLNSSFTIKLCKLDGQQEHYDAVGSKGLFGHVTVWYSWYWSMKSALEELHFAEWWDKATSMEAHNRNTTSYYSKWLDKHLCTHLMTPNFLDKRDGCVCDKKQTNENCHELSWWKRWLGWTRAKKLRLDHVGFFWRRPYLDGMLNKSVTQTCQDLVPSVALTSLIFVESLFLRYWTMSIVNACQHT